MSHYHQGLKNPCVYPDKERKQCRLKIRKIHMCPLGEFESNFCSVAPPVVQQNGQTISTLRISHYPI